MSYPTSYTYTKQIICGQYQIIPDVKYDFIFNKIYDNNNYDIYTIYEELHNKISNYSDGAIQISSGQDMSYYQKQKELAINIYKENALRQIALIWLRIIKNCKLVLFEHDMLYEFKNYYHLVAHYFFFKEADITWEIIGKQSDSKIGEFVNNTLSCVLSLEADNKKAAKLKIQNELREKINKETKEILFTIEFECMKIFEEIEKNRMNSRELYVEYKTIQELKQKYKPSTNIISQNILFLDYFTNEKKKYLNNLIMNK